MKNMLALILAVGAAITLLVGLFQGVEAWRAMRNGIKDPKKLWGITASCMIFSLLFFYASYATSPFKEPDTEPVPPTSTATTLAGGISPSATHTEVPVPSPTLPPTQVEVTPTQTHEVIPSPTSAPPNYQATSAARSANPYFENQGTLTLSDPLIDNSKGNNWDEGNASDNSSCSFTDGAYYAIQTTSGYIHECMARSTNYNDCTFEVQMTIIQGKGGIIFRSIKDNGTWYNLTISANGEYWLTRLDGPNSKEQTLKSGSVPKMYTGSGQLNVVAAVINGNSIDLYMNHYKFCNMNDSTYDHGGIGVFAGVSSQVKFSNAKVWT